MKRTFLGLAGLALASVVAPSAAVAWSEADCERLCRKTAVNASNCIVQQACSQYRGGKSARAGKIQSLTKAYNAQYGAPTERRRQRR